MSRRPTKNNAAQISSIVLLSPSGSYEPSNAWAMSLPESKLPAILASLRAAAIESDGGTAEAFDDNTEFELSQPEQGRKLPRERRRAILIAAQLWASTHSRGKNACTAVNEAVARGAV